MASDQTIDQVESLLSEAYPKAAEWFAAERAEANDDPQGLSLYAAWRRAWRTYHDDVVLKGLHDLLTSTPDYWGTNFLGLLFKHVDPLQERAWAEERDRRLRDGLVLDEGEQTDSGLLEGKAEALSPSAPSHGDGDHVYKTRTDTHGHTHVHRDTHDDSRRAFAHIAALMHRGPKQYQGRVAYPCGCGYGTDDRQEFERHALIHYPPGAQVHHARRLGVDIREVRKAQRKAHQGTCWVLDKSGDKPKRKTLTNACPVCSGAVKLDGTVAA